MKLLYRIGELPAAAFAMLTVHNASNTMLTVGGTGTESKEELTNQYIHGQLGNIGDSAREAVHQMGSIAHLAQDVAQQTTSVPEAGNQIWNLLLQCMHPKELAAVGLSVAVAEVLRWNLGIGTGRRVPVEPQSPPEAGRHHDAPHTAPAVAIRTADAPSRR